MRSITNRTRRNDRKLNDGQRPNTMASCFFSQHFNVYMSAAFAARVTFEVLSRLGETTPKGLGPSKCCNVASWSACSQRFYSAFLVAGCNMQFKRKCE